MDEKELVEALKSEVAPLKKEVSEYKAASEAKIDRVNADVNLYIKSLEEQIKVKASGDSINELQAQLKGAGEKYDELVKKFEEQGGDIKALATRLNAESLPGGSHEARIKSMKSQIQDAFAQFEERGSLSPNFTKSDRVFLNDGQYGVRDFTTKAVGTMTTANLTNGYASRDISQDVVLTPQNKTHIRQLLPKGTLGNAIFSYPRENGGEGGVGYQQNEGDIKPQIDYDLTMVNIVPAQLAVWMKVSRQSLADISWLSGYASRRMTEDLLNYEDTQILYGDATNNRLDGIIPTATAYVKTEATYVTLFEYLVDMVAQQETLNYNTNGILLHPRDYARLLVYKTTTGEFDFPGLVFGGADRSLLTFMGIPIYKSNRIARLTALVGQWDYAELLIREGISFDISYEDTDNFVRNLVTLRIEERVALAKYQTAAFMKANLATIYS